MIKPKVCTLRSDGTNCDEELFYAFEKFGASPEYVHVNQLRSKDKDLKNYQILALPGGFSYGDDIASGKVLAIELISFLKDQISNFVEKKNIVVGICNGFQVLVRTGLLPFRSIGTMDVTLAPNDSGHFECRWIKIRSEKSPCVFLSDPVSKYNDTGPSKSGRVFQLPVNHGEGKFFTDDKTLNKIEEENLIIFRYIDEENKPTQQYPKNPNGSLNAIAGICDPTGRILGLMPHPEKFVDITQHPNWRRFPDRKPGGAAFFKNMINFVKNS